MNGLHSVEKIGGTSISATDIVLDNVLIAGRTGADLYGRVFVVSAFAGMTDLLLDHKKSGKPGVYTCFLADDPVAPWQDALMAVRKAMRSVNARIFARRESRVLANRFVEARIGAIRACLEDLDRLRAHGSFRLTEPFATLREMLAGMGEAHSAFCVAALLRDRGVNAAMIDLTDWTATHDLTLDVRIMAGLEGVDVETQMPIVTGYVACEGGMLSRYDRGYTEITFARLAALTRPSEAIIHKEFHLSSADPKLIGGSARKIGRTNYDVADQLANLGMEAIHPRAGRELRRAEIALRVRNTFDREDEGTLICGDYVSGEPRVEIVTGRRSVFALQFYEQDMLGEKGYDAAILESLARHKAWIVSKSSNANTITHHLSTSAKVIRRLIEDLEGRYPNATVTARAVAMVSVIGSDISAPGLVAQAMTALSEAGIIVIGLQHQIRNVDIQFLIEPEDFDRAVRVLHEALVAAPCAEKPGVLEAA